MDSAQSQNGPSSSERRLSDGQTRDQHMTANSASNNSSHSPVSYQSSSSRFRDPPSRKGSGQSDSSYSDKLHPQSSEQQRLTPLSMHATPLSSGQHSPIVPPSPVASSSGPHSPRTAPARIPSPHASPRSKQSQSLADTDARRRGSTDVQSTRQRSSTGASGRTDKRSSGDERPSSRSQPCAKCHLPVTGQFVRALGAVYHLDCFRCQDCSKVVAAKFFPIDAPDSKSPLKQVPLCETDYFRRLDLLCAKCGCALRGSYITALDKKYHVEHFTCSVCPTVFGPQDSYYEHSGQVYCHFHYSTRFAVKCTGCRTAILKQFVEINRNSVDEHWHPECYMIHKFWHIKLAPTPPSPRIRSEEDADEEGLEGGETADATESKRRRSEDSDFLDVEARETPETLKAKQKKTEEQVYRIWTVLSSFEESSAASISEMLRHVGAGHYIDGVKMAEKFVVHVETLFCSIDHLSDNFTRVGAPPIPYVREARMLCKKVVNFFSLLSHTHEVGARKITITQDLLSLVTGLAHYLKILIRIALTSALRLEQEFGQTTAISELLSRLDRLSKEPSISQQTAGSKKKSSSPIAITKLGYESLERALSPTNGLGDASTDLCESCRQTVEDECLRHGTGLRWHFACLRCSHCGKKSRKDREPGQGNGSDESRWYGDFAIEPTGHQRLKGGRTICPDCSSNDAVRGFERVTKLEQYAYLLCVALNKLYSLLQQRGAVPLSSDSASERSLHDAYRDSTEIKRMKSVQLDRKLSSTTARIPKRSTVVQSPSGRTAQPSNESASSKPPVPSRKDQPVYDPARGATIPRSPVSQQSRTMEHSTSSQGSQANVPGSPVRPEFHRQTTAVHIVDDQAGGHPQQDSSGLGGPSEPTQDEGGITLADLPTVMEAEQAREQHRVLPQRSGMLLSELSALEHFIIKHVAALMLASESSPLVDLVPLDDLLDIIDARKNTFWGKLFKGGNDKKSNKKKGVFGVPLEILVERNGADSMHGAGPGSLRIPSFVDDVISAMKQMDMSIEGIFRKNGNIRRLKELSEAIDRDSSSVNLPDDNPVQLAALLKRFLRDLPDPLLTFKLFSLFLGTQRIENFEQRKMALHLVCCLLPKAHRDTMEALFVFLKWVASFSHVDEETGSKMDLQNLATVISPNILYPKGKEPFREESFSAVRAVHELLEYQDDFWLVPAQFTPILNEPDLFTNPSQLTSKEILARAEKYVRIGGGSSSSGHRARNGHGPNGVPFRGEVAHQHPDYSPPYVSSTPSMPPGGMRSPRESTNGAFPRAPVSLSSSPSRGFAQPSEGMRPMSFSSTPGHSSSPTPASIARGTRLAPISTSHSYTGQQLVGSPTSPGAGYGPPVSSTASAYHHSPLSPPTSTSDGGASSQSMNRYESKSSERYAPPSLHHYPQSQQHSGNRSHSGSNASVQQMASSPRAAPRHL